MQVDAERPNRADCRRSGSDPATRARRLTLVGAVVDQELVYLDRLVADLLALDRGPLSVPQIFEGLEAQRRMMIILQGRREELRPWGVE